MMKPETKFRQRVQRDLDTLPNTWAESIQQKSIRGSPDIISCINGLFVALELKIKGNGLTPLQKYKGELIKKAGGVFLGVWPEDWDETFIHLKSLAYGKIERTITSD